MDRLALFEANLEVLDHQGPAALKQEKLSAIQSSEEEVKMFAGWEAVVRVGRFSESLKAAEQIGAYVAREEKVQALPKCPHLLPANAVRFVRMGGTPLLTTLAGSPDLLMKRAVASALFSCFKEELPRIELAKGDAS